MRKIKFQRGKFYHLYNRGIERRIIFNSQEDYDRFEAYLYLLNDEMSDRPSNYFFKGRKSSIFETRRAEPLVAIGAYCLMPNHFHILATPIAENGLPRFMHKLQTAYTMYYNEKYDREGRLFAGTYKAEVVEKEERLKYLLAYIHLNPAKLFNSEWRNVEGYEFEKLASAVMEYRYSSAHEYIERTHLITSPKYFPKYFERSRSMDSFLTFWRKFAKMGD